MRTSAIGTICKNPASGIRINPFSARADTGECIALDYVLFPAVVPELAARFYNLEAIPAEENGSKGAKIGKRELDLARRWNREGLLSAAGLAAVEAAGAK